MCSFSYNLIILQAIVIEMTSFQLINMDLGKTDIIVVLLYKLTHC